LYQFNPRLHMQLLPTVCCVLFSQFLGLAYQGKDIVFRFIMEYTSSFMDFGP